MRFALPAASFRSALLILAALALGLSVLGAAASLPFAGIASAGADPDAEAEERAEEEAEERAEEEAEERAEEEAEDRAEEEAEERAEEEAEERAEEEAEERAEEQAEDRAEEEAEERAEREAEERAEEAAEERAEAAAERLEALQERAEDRAEVARERSEAAAERARERREQLEEQLEERNEEAAEAREEREEERPADRADVFEERALAAFDDVFEPDGEPAVAGEIVALLSAPAFERARAQGYELDVSERLSALDAVLVRVSVDDDSAPAQALADFSRRVDALSVDYNHLYKESGQDKESGESRRIRAAVAAAAEPRAATRSGPVGMIDSAVARSHPCLERAHAGQRDFRAFAGGGLAHGTAVAFILSGCSAAPEAAPLPLLSAAVFFDDPSGARSATAASLVRALDWLAEAGAGVINMSLAGPPNGLLEAAIAAVHRRGVILVAAVGNEGPASPPRFPAAYPQVVGVTAVDSALGVYGRAGRGGHVDFAAPGVEVAVLLPEGAVGASTGTSMAAPYAARLLARMHAAAPALSAQDVVARAAASALDLGPPGQDPIFGYGLIRPFAGRAHAQDR